jgi:hypothetical protein
VSQHLSSVLGSRKAFAKRHQAKARAAAETARAGAAERRAQKAENRINETLAVVEEELSGRTLGAGVSRSLDPS